MTTTNGESISEETAINQCVSEAGVFLAHWPLPQKRILSGLLGQPSLSAEQKEELLEEFNEIFVKLQTEMGMKSRDLIVLHPDTPGLFEMLDRFSPCHTHDDEEVRYIIDGEGEFGFVLPSAVQVLLKVEPGDFIRIPKNTEHWFVLTEQKRIKAIRYFSDTTGWVPKYTSTPVRIS